MVPVGRGCSPVGVALTSGVTLGHTATFAVLALSKIFSLTFVGEFYFFLYL